MGRGEVGRYHQGQRGDYCSGCKLNFFSTSNEVADEKYVATRMALKPSAKTQTRPATPGPEAVESEGKTTETVSSEPEAGGKKDD